MLRKTMGTTILFRMILNKLEHSISIKPNTLKKWVAVLFCTSLNKKYKFDLTD